MLASAAMTELARVMADNPGGVIETVAKGARRHAARRGRGPAGLDAAFRTG